MGKSRFLRRTPGSQKTAGDGGRIGVHIQAAVDGQERIIVAASVQQSASDARAPPYSKTITLGVRVAVFCDADS